MAKNLKFSTPCRHTTVCVTLIFILHLQEREVKTGGEERMKMKLRRES